MGIDPVQVFRSIESAFASTSTMGDGVRSVIETCARLRPHRDWSRFTALPIDSPKATIDWLTRVLKSEPMPAATRGLWFGLYNPVRDGAPVADMHVAGATDFDDSGETNDWAGEAAWDPALDANSDVLAEIYRIAYGVNGLQNDAEYPVCLAYAGLAVREALKDRSVLSLIPDTGPIGVAVGFDGGDWINLGHVTRQGWVPRE